MGTNYPASCQAVPFRYKNISLSYLQCYLLSRSSAAQTIHMALVKKPVSLCLPSSERPPRLNGMDFCEWHEVNLDGVASAAAMDLVAIHSLDYTTKDYVKDSCCHMLNVEWPRSHVLRMRSLNVRTSQFLHLLLKVCLNKNCYHTFISLFNLQVPLSFMPWLHLQATQADGLCLGLPTM